MQTKEKCEKINELLNGKAKNDFEVFQIHRSLAITNSDRLESSKLDFKDLEPYLHQIWRMDKLYLNALIIDFFDSVGIYISIEPQKDFRNVYFDVSIDFELHSVWNTRIEAASKAIEKANELYNAKVI